MNKYTICLLALLAAASAFLSTGLSNPDDKPGVELAEGATIGH